MTKIKLRVLKTNILKNFENVFDSNTNEYAKFTLWNAGTSNISNNRYNYVF